MLSGNNNRIKNSRNKGFLDESVDTKINVNLDEI